MEDGTRLTAQGGGQLEDTRIEVEGAEGRYVSVVGEHRIPNPVLGTLARGPERPQGECVEPEVQQHLLRLDRVGHERTAPDQARATDHGSSHRWCVFHYVAEEQRVLDRESGWPGPRADERLTPILGPQPVSDDLAVAEEDRTVVLHGHADPS